MDRIQHRTAGTPTDPEDILGQFFFAFGQGAGTMRVQRGAIAALRRRYRPAIGDAYHQWDTAAPHVLSLVAQVGRLAACLATQAGRAAISEGDFLAARRAVEANAHATAESDGRLVAGPFCPPVPGEVPATLVVTTEREGITPVAPVWETRAVAPSPHAH